MGTPTLATSIVLADTLAADLRTIQNPPPPNAEPQTILLSGPTNSTATTATIDVTATDDRPGPFTYEQSADGGLTWARFVPPLKLSGLVPGHYERRISALDADGLRDSSPLIVAWEVLPVVVPPAPPPPAGALDPLVIYDDAEGITGDALYKGKIYWKNRGGDWGDADGVAQGPKPFASLLLTTGQTGPFVLDVTPLVVPGIEPQMMLRSQNTANMGAIFNLASKEFSPLNAPRLDVVYQDGSSGSLLCMHDAAANTSTATARTDLTVAGNSNCYLRFPAPTQAVKTAKLWLAGSINTGGNLQVFKFAVHRDPIPAFDPKATLVGDSRVFLFTEAFDDAPYYIQAKVFGGPAPALPDSWNQRRVVTTPVGRALEVMFDPRGSSALNASVCFPGFDEADECAWQFDIYLIPGIEDGLRDGVKLFAGLSSSTKNDDAYFCGWSGMRYPDGTQVTGRAGTLLAGNSGTKANGVNGHTMRWDMWNTPPAPHPLHGRFLPMQYVYHPEQTDYYGTPWSWDLTQASLRTAVWYTIYQRGKINTVGPTFVNPVTFVPVADQLAPSKTPNGMSVLMNTGRLDAEFFGAINGVPAVRKDNFRLRNTLTPLISLPPYNVRSRLAFGRMWLNAYHGGTTVPLTRCGFMVRNFRAARFA